jgi:hypothetical protein
MPVANATGGETSPLAETTNARMNNTFEILDIDWKKSIKRTAGGPAGYPAVVLIQSENTPEVPFSYKAAIQETHPWDTDV